MSDITLRLAEACEDAEVLFSLVRWREIEHLSRADAERILRSADALKTLAAALRGATEVSSLDSTRIVNVVIALGDA